MALISVIIPIFNESGHLKEFLELVDSFKFPAEHEFVFVDDCSKDDSLGILKAFAFKSASIKILEQKKNQGKGAAIQRGLKEAQGDIIIIQDADFEYDLDDLPTLLEPILSGKADAVYGSRFKKSGFQVHRTFHYLINKFLTTVSNALCGLYLTDMETCYKIFRSEVLQNIKLSSKRFGFEPEITAKIARLNIRVFELPISYFPRNYLEGKKITWKDGIAALWHIIYFNLFQSKKDYILEGMPKRYLIGGSKLL